MRFRKWNFFSHRQGRHPRPRRKQNTFLPESAQWKERQNRNQI